ncbi:hypothetical protein SBY92_001382 [Candida maltosa Xu316]
MGIFDILQFQTPAKQSIPTYDPTIDSTNLQVKSLQYIFKRYRINNLSSFLTKDNHLQYTTNTKIDLENDPMISKLDQVYDVNGFMRMYLGDEYRILVDFMKNKFRSMCILSSLPDFQSRPGSPVKGKSSNGSNCGLELRDYKDRSVSGFRFVVMELQMTNRERIVEVLTSSDIYMEHNVEYAKKYSIAVESVNKVLEEDRFDVSIPQKNEIVRNYLTGLAFYVQLMRIYEEYNKQHPLVYNNSASNPSSPTKIKSLRKTMSGLSLNKQNEPTSPTKPVSISRPSSPVKYSRPPSPTKTLSKKPSVSKLKLEELYNPVANPRKLNIIQSPSEQQQPSQDDHNMEESRVIRADVYEKCKAAIIQKLKIEKTKLR